MPTNESPWRFVQMCERCDCQIVRTELTDEHLIALRDTLRLVVAGGGEGFSGAELLNRFIEEFAAARLLLAEIVRYHEGEVPAPVYAGARRLIEGGGNGD